MSDAKGKEIKRSRESLEQEAEAKTFFALHAQPHRAGRSPFYRRVEYTGKRGPRVLVLGPGGVFIEDKPLGEEMRVHAANELLFDMIQKSDSSVLEKEITQLRNAFSEMGIEPDREDLPSLISKVVLFYNKSLQKIQQLPKGKGLTNVPGSAWSKEERLAIENFMDPVKPCEFEGCEDLRNEMHAEIEAAGGASCSGCTRGQIVTQFTQRARILYAKSKNSE